MCFLKIANLARSRDWKQQLRKKGKLATFSLLLRNLNVSMFLFSVEVRKSMLEGDCSRNDIPKRMWAIRNVVNAGGNLGQLLFLS